MTLDQSRNRFTVIIANGEYPTHQYPISFIKSASYTICLDGALELTLKNGVMPDIIIGDGDSILPILKEQYSHLLLLNTDQNTNDLTKAINYCREKGLKNIKIVAASGKREDHTLGNISLLLEYMNDADVEMITDYGIFTPIVSTTKFESIAGQQVSIFNIDNTPITSHNLKYPLREMILDNLWKGTLNESLGKWFTIETKGKTIVYRAFETKEK